MSYLPDLVEIAKARRNIRLLRAYLRMLDARAKVTLMGDLR